MEVNEKINAQSILKENITKWYPFTPNATILEIRDCLEPVKEERYDYVVLIGTLEYAEELFTGENPKEQLLEYAKKHLKEDGRILLAVNNKIGVKNYCEKKANSNTSKKLNRKELEKLLETCNLNYCKFYYPLPDYKTANVIFTDDFLPNEETIARNIALHEGGDTVFQSENKLFLDLLEQDGDLFKLFTNCYLIECSTKEFPNNEIKFVSFSNMRKPEYSIKTIIQGDKVYKTARDTQAKNHIERVKQNINLLNKLGFETLDSYEKDVIISQYQKENKTLDNFLIHQIKSGKKEEAISLMKRFFQEIKEKLTTEKAEENVFDRYGITYETEQIENLTFTKYGLWDLIFQNAFYMNDKFFFYDQEWMEEGIPIEYIFYRSIKYTQELKEMIEEEEIFNQFGITKKQLDLFLELDNQLQENTRNDEVWKAHKQGQNIQRLIKQEEQAKQDKEKILEDCKKLLNEKDARICFLEENMENTVKLLQQRESELSNIKKSIWWKMTKPWRVLRKKGIG